MADQQPNRDEADIENRDREQDAHKGRQARGSREDDRGADVNRPGGEFGAGAQVDDGPHATRKPTPRGAH